MRLFLVACSLWLVLLGSHTKADDISYTSTISCKSISNIFLLMHMWKYYGEAERAEALVYLIYTRGSCTAYRALHPALSYGTSITSFEMPANEKTILVSLLMIPTEQGTEYVISNQLKE